MVRSKQAATRSSVGASSGSPRPRLVGSLRHAQDYIHQVEGELAQQREQARQLQQEVGVLREQNRRLVEEQQLVPEASP